MYSLSLRDNFTGTFILSLFLRFNSIAELRRVNFLLWLNSIVDRASSLPSVTWIVYTDRGSRYKLYTCLTINLQTVL